MIMMESMGILTLLKPYKNNLKLKTTLTKIILVPCKWIPPQQITTTITLPLLQM
jgi:hypothetical protein